MADVDLLPDGADDFEDEEVDVDLDSLTLNFSTEEATSEARLFEALPTGEYRCAITKVEIRKSKSSKNLGKPYYALELTVQEGQYENRKLFTNVMLFEGALYTYAQLAKALNRDLNGPVLKPSELQGARVGVVVRKMADKYLIEQDGWTPSDGPKPMKAEVRGFKKYDIVKVGGSAAAQGVSQGAAGSLLP